MSDKMSVINNVCMHIAVAERREALAQHRVAPNLQRNYEQLKKLSDSDLTKRFLHGGQSGSLIIL